MLDKQTNHDKFELSWKISEIDIYKIEELLLNNEINDTKKLEKSLINMLNKWLNIQNERMYISMNRILNNLGLIKLCNFSEIKAVNWYSLFTMWYEFSIKLEDDYIRIFPSTILTGFWIFNPTQLWYIYDGKFYGKLNNNISDNIINNNQFNFNNQGTQNLLNTQNQELITINEELRREQEELLEQREQDRIQILDLQNQVNTQQCPIGEQVEEEGDIVEDVWEITVVDEVVENDTHPNNQIEWDTNLVVVQPIVNTPDIQETIPQDKDYIVKSGDNLWSIVKKYYWLMSNRDIANYVNKLVKYNITYNKDSRNIADDNTPDGIFWDKIYIGQKIILAKELTFNKKTIPLLNKET